MAPRWTASLFALPAGAVIAAAITLMMRWISGIQGLLPTQYVAMALVVLASFGVAARLAGIRAASSERPLRGASLGLLVLGAWMLGAVHIAPFIAGLGHGLGGGAAHAAVQAVGHAPWAFAAGWTLPYLVRAAVPSIPSAAPATGMMLGLLLIGAGLGLAFAEPLAAEHGYALLTRALGFVALGTTLFLLLLDRPLPHGSAPPPDARLGSLEDGQNPLPALVTLGFLLGSAWVTWTFLLQPFAGDAASAARLVWSLGLGALGLGALVGGWLAKWAPRPDQRLLMCLAGTAYLALLTLPLLSSLPLLLLNAGADGSSRSGVLWTRAAWVIAPPLFVAGVTVLMAFRVRTEWTGTAALAVGRLAAGVVTGALVGGILARYVILPGANPTLALLGAAGLVVGTAALLRLRSQVGASALGALLTALPLGVLLIPGLLTGWVSSTPSPVAAFTARHALPAGARLEDAEDVALYGAFFSGGARTRNPAGVRVGRHVDFGGPALLIAQPDELMRIEQAGCALGALGAGTESGARAEVALGLLPALLHKRPERALILGPGSGRTTQVLLGARLAHVDVVTRSTAGLAAAAAYTGDDHVLRPNLRTTLVQAGARAHLADAQAAQYDLVIVGAPFEPTLFTREALDAIRVAMTPDGIVALHLPYEAFDPEVFRRVLITIRDAWPSVVGYRYSDSAVVLAGRAVPPLQTARFGTLLRAPAKSAALATPVGLGTRGAILRHLAFDTESLERLLTEGIAPLTDDSPWLAESRAHRFRAGETIGSIDDLLNLAFPPDLTTILPSGAALDRWIGPAISGWLEENPFVATVWDQAIPYGSTPEGWRVRGLVASVRGEPELAARFFGLAARTAEQDAGRYAAMQIEALSDAAHAGKIPADQARDEVVAISEAHAADGRVWAATGAAHRAFGDLVGARKAYETALRAKQPGPPKGTGIALAQIHMTEVEPDFAAVRALLAADPALYADTEALDLYVSILAPDEHAKRSAELEAVAETLRMAEAARRTRAVRRWVSQHRFKESAEDAARVTELTPGSTEAWTLRGLVDLCRAGAENVPAGRQQLSVAAQRALLEAIKVSRTPDQTRRELTRMARWFGISLPNEAK